MSLFANYKPTDKFMQELQDEFLTCKICLESFTTPKTLDCLHTFCEKCIEYHLLSECKSKRYSDFRDITCPLCRKTTQIPVGGVKKLSDNILLSTLANLVYRAKPLKIRFCQICSSDRESEATSKCLDCNKLLCRSCVIIHKATLVTQGHSLYNLEMEKDIICHSHTDENVRFFCKVCRQCICIACTFDDHQDHEVVHLQEAVDKYKKDIEILLNDSKNKIEIFEQQISKLTICDNRVKKCEQQIHNTAESFVDAIRSKEKQLINDLHNEYGLELLSHAKRLKEMQNNLDNFKSTCDVTDLVLKSKDIEILIIEKDIEQKLSVLSKSTLKNLPCSADKCFVFEPGAVDLGSLRETYI